MSTKNPSSSPTPDGNKPATPPPFATRKHAGDEESEVISLAQSLPAAGVPLVASSEEMRKVYSHFAHLAMDPASLKLPKPKSLHLTLEERAEVDMPIPAHKRNPKLLELLRTDETVRSDFKRHAVEYWTVDNYTELDDQVKDIIIRNKSLGADTNVVALYPAEVQPGGTGTAQLKRKSPTKAKSTWKAPPKELSRWGGQIKSTFEKQEELKNKRITKLKKATNRIGQKSKVLTSFKAFGAESIFKQNGSASWDSSPPSPDILTNSPKDGGLSAEQSVDERANETRAMLIDAYGENADVEPRKSTDSIASSRSPSSKLRLLMGSKSTPGLESFGSNGSMSPFASPIEKIYESVMAEVNIADPPYELEPPDPRAAAILNMKNPVHAVGADDIWITEMKNIIQVHARRALPWQAQTNATALMALFDQRRKVASKIEAGRVIKFRREQEALMEHHRRTEMDIITKWRDFIKTDTKFIEEETAKACAAEEDEDRLLAEEKQKELTDMFLDFAAQQIADMNRNEYAHFETDSAKITEKWSLGLVNIERRVEHVRKDQARRDESFEEMQAHAKTRYHEYDGRVMGLQNIERARVEKQTSMAEKRALQRFEEEKSRVKKIRFHEAKRRIKAASKESERAQIADLQERRRVAVEAAVDNAVTESSLEYILFLLQTMVKPQLSWMENEQIFWRLKVVADQGAEIRRVTKVTRSKDSKDHSKTRSQWENKMKRWRMKVERGQEELDRLEDERVLLRAKIERHRVGELLEETKKLVDASAEARWHSLAGSRRINFRCIRLLHNFVNEVNELNEIEVQRNFSAVIEEKVRQDKANNVEEVRIAEALKATTEIAASAEEIEYQRVSVHEQQSVRLAQKIAEERAAEVKAAEYEDLLNDLDRESNEANLLQERVPELIQKVVEIEQSGWHAEALSDLLQKSESRSRKDISKDVEEEKAVSVESYELWNEFCTMEKRVLEESQTRENMAHIKAIEDAAAAVRAFEEKDQKRIAHEIAHERKLVQRFLNKQADATKLAVDGERYARLYNAGQEESRVAIWESEEALNNEHFKKKARNMMEIIVSELISLADQGHALSDETMLGINQFEAIKDLLIKKGSSLFDLPLTSLPRGNIGFFHRVHRRGGDEDTLEAGLMPISQVEADAMVLDELLDLVRNEKLAAESPAVLHMLPQNIFEWVTSADFERDCSEKFLALDTEKAGILTAVELFPVVCSLTDGSPLAVTEHHCRRFIDAFDSNGDNVIDAGEFAAFIRFLIVATYVDIKNGGPADGDTGDTKIDTDPAMEEQQFWDDKRRVTALIEDIERDKAMVDEILTQLPQTITDVLASDDFVLTCNTKFDELDEDGSGAIEPDELYPLLVEMSQGFAWAVDNEHCVQFASLFDVKENGVIDRDEFVGFCKFVFIISYLKKGEGGDVVTPVEVVDEINQESSLPWEDPDRISTTVARLQVEPRGLESAILDLPEELGVVLSSDEFENTARKCFEDMAQNWDAAVAFNVTNIPVQIINAFMSMSLPSYTVSIDAATEIIGTYADAMFDDRSAERTVAISSDDFIFVCRYVVVVNFLYRSLEAAFNAVEDTPFSDSFSNESNKRNAEVEDGDMQDTLHMDREKVSRMIKEIRDDKAMVAQYMAQLPADVSSVLSSPAFGISCREKFDALDLNNSGVLEPEQLIPIIVELSHGHKWALTEQHVIDFTALFDVKENGVIDREEFRELCTFVAVMRYLDSLAAELESNAAPLSPEVADIRRALPGMDDEVNKFPDANFHEENNKMEWRTDDIPGFLKTLRSDPSSMDEAVTCLPTTIAKELTDGKFSTDCIEVWKRDIDPQETGMAMPEELYGPIVRLSEGTPWDLNGKTSGEKTCARHVDALFEGATGGQTVVVLAQNDFPNICRFVFAITFAEAELKVDTELALGMEGLLQDEDRLKFVIEQIQNNPKDIQKMLHRIPGEVSSFFKSRRFAEACYVRFDVLDNQKKGRKKGNGKVDPALLAPELLDLTGHTSWGLEKEEMVMDYFASFNVEQKDHVTRGDFCAFCTYACALNFFRGSLKILQKTHEELEIGKDVEESEQTRISKLIDCLVQERDVVSHIIPRLGSETAAFLESDGFVTMCERRFNALDTDGSGQLEPAELAPIIKSLLRSRNANISLEDCERFASLWDKNKDGVISRDEYVPFCRFLVVMSNLEQMALEKDAEEDQQLSQEEKDYLLWQEHEEVSEVIQKLIDDRDAVFRLREHLPDNLNEYLTSRDFEADCFRRFDALDSDGSGSLEAGELAPIIHELAKDAPHVSADVEQCRQFMSVFHQSTKEETTYPNALQGVTRNEFAHLCEFIIVLNYMHSLREAEEEAFAAAEARAEVERELVWEDSIRVSAMLENVSKNVRLVEDMLPRLPMVVRRALTSPMFEQKCDYEFGKLDADGNGKLSPDELYPAVCELSEEFAYNVSLEHCEAMAKMFDSSQTGTIGRVDFVRFCRFLHLTAYLKALSNPETAASALDILLGRTGDNGSFNSADNGGQDEDVEWNTNRVSEIISSMEANRNEMGDIIAQLPGDVAEYFLSTDFAMMCESKYRELDIDGNGTLSVDELYPVLIEMTESQPYDVTFDHCRRVAQIFDDDKNGVISASEFKEFFLFMCITAWLLSKAPSASKALGAIDEGEEDEDEEDNEGQEDKQVDSSGVFKNIEEAVVGVSNDKIRVDSLIPQLPPTVRATLESADFQFECAKVFDELDAVERKAGVLPPSVLGPLIQRTVFASTNSVSEQWAITPDHCVRFASMFDAEKNGLISRDEFPQYAKLVAVMCFMESSNTMNVDIPVVVAEPVGFPIVEGIAPSEDEQRALQAETEIDETVDGIEASGMLSDLIETVKENKEVIEAYLPQLPQEILDDLNSAEFASGCDAKFAEIDQDCNGVLSPEELFPVIEELFQPFSWAVTMQHCVQFASIFDEDGNGQISRSEFLTFCKFLAIIFKIEEDETGKDADQKPRMRHEVAEEQTARRSIHSEETEVVPATSPNNFDEHSLLSFLLKIPNVGGRGDRWLPLASVAPAVRDALKLAKMDEQLAPLLLSFANCFGGTVSLRNFCSLARFTIGAQKACGTNVLGAKTLDEDVLVAINALVKREIDAAMVAMILEADEMESPQPGVLSTLKQPSRKDDEGSPLANLLSATDMLLGAAAAVHITERERNAMLCLLAEKAVEQQYKEMTLSLSITKDGSISVDEESWKGMDELERMNVQTSFRKNRERVLREVLLNVKTAAYVHTVRFFALEPLVRAVHTYLKRQCEAAAVKPVSSIDGEFLVPLASLKRAVTELPWVIITNPMAARILATVTAAPRTGVRLFKGLAHLPMHSSIKILAQTVQKSMSREELALESRMIDEVYDEINIQMPPPSASAGGTTISSNASTKSRSRKVRPKPAVAINPAMREMTGFMNVSALTESLYLHLEEIDALDHGVLPITVAQMVLDTHSACQRLTAFETAFTVSFAVIIHPSDGSDNEGEYFDGGMSSGQMRELIYYKDFARLAACAIELLCEQRFRGDAMTNYRPLPLPENVKMPILWMMRLERVACAYVKGIVLGRDVYEGMIQQMRLARFSKRSGREAEYQEHLRKEANRVQEAAEIEAARVQKVLDWRVTHAEEQADIERQRVETREMLDNLTRLVAYKEGREALDFFLENSAECLRVTVIAERRVMDHVAVLERTEQKQYQVEADRIESFRSEDTKVRQKKAEERNEQSQEWERELNKEITAAHENLKKITDEANLNGKEYKQKCQEKMTISLDRYKKELEQKLEELDGRLEQILDQVEQNDERLNSTIADLDPYWKDPSIKDPKSEKAERKKMCKQPIPVLEDLVKAIRDVFNVDPKAPSGTKPWIETLTTMRINEIKDHGGESRVLVANSRKKFQSKFDKEIDQNLKATVRKQDELFSLKKEADTKDTEEYNVKLDEESTNIDELFKQASANFTELLGTKKSKVRDYWEKRKAVQRKANTEKIDATESKVLSLKRQLDEKILETKPKAEDEACARRLYEARSHCMKQRAKAYCDAAMSLYNGRSMETEKLCTEKFKVVFDRLEPANQVRKDDFDSWRGEQLKDLASEIKDSIDNFWKYMKRQYDRTEETKTPMPKLDLLLLQERKRFTKLLDNVEEDRATKQSSAEDNLFKAKKNFMNGVTSLEMKAIEKLEGFKQLLKSIEENKLGWDVNGIPIQEQSKAPEPKAEATLFDESTGVKVTAASTIASTADAAFSSPNGPSEQENLTSAPLVADDNDSATSFSVSSSSSSSSSESKTSAFIDGAELVSSSSGEEETDEEEEG